jgi:predicted enzyme related to lactoylglutathione lyase
MEGMDYILWEPGEGPGGAYNPLGNGLKPGDVLLYVDSDDIEADLKKAVKLGGTLVREKTEIPGIGWFGEFKDPTGNTIAVFTSMNPKN